MAEHFIIPKKYYQLTLIALLILTVFTVAISRVDLGVLNTPMALFVAIVKTTFVGAFFMGLKWEQFNLVFVVSAIAGIILFFLFTFADIAYRGEITDIVERPHSYNSPVNVISADKLHEGDGH